MSKVPGPDVITKFKSHLILHDPYSKEHMGYFLSCGAPKHGGAVSQGDTMPAASGVESVYATLICVGNTHPGMGSLAHSAYLPRLPLSLGSRLFWNVAPNVIKMQAWVCALFSSIRQQLKKSGENVLKKL